MTGSLKKGPWTGAEDEVLIEYVRAHGEGNWNAVQKHSGLNRCGKSCRLRWANHLRPNLKKGSFSHDEESLILDLHSKYGNKWARMATQLPGRTDNEIKNYWNTRVKRRKRQGLPLYPNDTNHHHQLTSPSTMSSSTWSTTPMSSSTWSTTPTPPTTPGPTNFPFHQQMTSPTTISSSSAWSTTPMSSSTWSTTPTPPTTPSPTNLPFQQQMPFSFQYRPVPLLSVPPPSFAGFSSSASHHLHHSSSSTAGLLDDILDNLLHHTSTEMGVKEEGLPQDLSHWCNGGDDSMALQMQQYFPVAASDATLTTNYSTPNPATWDSMPGIGKVWFKHN